MSLEDILKGKTELSEKSNLVYSIEFLAHLAMSPFCLMPPEEWDGISKNYPFLIKNVSWIWYYVLFLDCFASF